MILLLACTAAPDPEPRSHLRIPELAAPGEPGRTLLLFTIDTLNEDYIGPDTRFDSSPELNRFFEESVVFENTVVPRGVTVISLPSLHTGTYPRTHEVRDQSLPPGMPATINELLRAEGWATFGYSSNMCHLLDQEWTGQLCSDPSLSDVKGGDIHRDQAVIDAFADDLERLPPERDAFFWLHLRDPHADYTPRDPWFSEWYEGTYTQEHAAKSEQVSGYTLGDPVPDGFQEWLETVYASQVRSSDEMFGEVRSMLEDAERWDVVVTGTDHGEELNAHHGYYLHGCSMYNEVLNTTYSVLAPGYEARNIATHVSSTDFLPTMLEVLELEPSPDAEGRSLVGYMAGEEPDAIDVFFERGPESAGVVRGDRKYWFFTGDKYMNCRPFQDVQGSWYEGPSEALFELAEDPAELLNLIGDEPKPPEKEAVCEWVTGEVWIDEESDPTISLVQRCHDYLDRL